MPGSPKSVPTHESRVLGCLLGGAIGDALGAPIEFMSLSEIQAQFGAQGLTEYQPAYGRLGAITDDTQMALWTAEGLIRADNRIADRGLCNVRDVIHRAYLRWLTTQGVLWHEIGSEWPEPSGWLIREDFLHDRRSPGATCISALRSGECGTMDRHLNDSKGCGSIMRVAPVGLAGRDVFRIGAESAAITHGHPTGYLAAGAFALIISEIQNGHSLEQSTHRAVLELKAYEGHQETLDAIEHALSLATSTKPSPQAIVKLGAGWIAEEALAISLYCTLVSQDFRTEVLLAVNHGGDSDSTGAITGNLLGALYGAESIPEQLISNLEGHQIVQKLAKDLTSHFLHGKSLHDTDDYPTW